MSLKLSKDGLSYLSSNPGWKNYTFQEDPSMLTPITSKQLGVGFRYNSDEKMYYLDNVVFTAFSGPVSIDTKLGMPIANLDWNSGFLILYQNHSMAAVWLLTAMWDDPSNIAFEFITGSFEDGFIWSTDGTNIFLEFTAEVELFTLYSDIPIIFTEVI